jgi:hypothetical protein
MPSLDPVSPGLDIPIPAYGRSTWEQRHMRVVPNRVVYAVQDQFARGLDNRYYRPGVYIRLGEKESKVVPGEWRTLDTWEMPMTSNKLGYSCHHCQGFITRGEEHVCREIGNLESKTKPKKARQ